MSGNSKASGHHLIYRQSAAAERVQNFKDSLSRLPSLPFLENRGWVTVGCLVTGTLPGQMFSTRQSTVNKKTLSTVLQAPAKNSNSADNMHAQMCRQHAPRRVSRHIAGAAHVTAMQMLIHCQPSSILSPPASPQPSPLAPRKTWAILAKHCALVFLIR